MKTHQKAKINNEKYKKSKSFNRKTDEQSTMSKNRKFLKIHKQIIVKKLKKM